MAAATGTFEQLYLEYVNAARTDPGSVYARVIAAQAADPDVASAFQYFGVDTAALQAQFRQLKAVAPLAWNDQLALSASRHSELMIRHDTQSHNLPGEAGLMERVKAAGYQQLQAVGENIYAYDQDPLFGFVAFFVDWGFDDEDFTPGGNLRPDFRDRGDGVQDPAGHRDSIMSDWFQEFGVAGLKETDYRTEVGSVVTTQHLGARFDYQAQFLGVVYDDRNGDRFYDFGEGERSVIITLSGAGGTFQTASTASGGWQIVVPAGAYDITFDFADAGEVTKHAVLGQDNVKVDARVDEAAPVLTVTKIAASAPADPVPDIAGGAASDVLIGDDAGETIFGYAGDDILSGRGGDDMLDGGDGRDRLLGGDGADVMAGGAGDDLYAVRQAGDQVVETADGGDRDRVNVYVDYVNPEHVEYLVGIFADHGLKLTGNADRNRIAGANKISSGDAIDGADGDDRLVGLVGDDEISGGAGRDRIFGNSGDDILIGGADNDVLTGQFGADRFVHAPGDGRDIVTDFDATADILDLTGHGFTRTADAFAQAADTADGLLFDFGGGDAVLLAGVALANLGPEDLLL